MLIMTMVTMDLLKILDFGAEVVEVQKQNSRVR